MEDYTLDVTRECPCFTPHGPYHKLKEKYDLTWEEYVTIWRYSCLVGSVNNDLLSGNEKIQQFKELLSNALDKLDKRTYPLLFAAIDFRPPLDWKIKTFRSTSYEISTPLEFMKGRDGIMVVFENVVGLPEITEISLYRAQYEVLIAPEYGDFSAYDIDYLPNDSYILYYRSNNSEKSSDTKESLESEILSETFLKLRKPVSVSVKWDSDAKIDIFGNNILHYMVGIMSNSGIWKYRNLLNIPNNAGVTPAMKLLRSGQYWVFMEYSELIDFKIKDSSNRGMMHYSASMIIPNRDELDNFHDCLYEISSKNPESISSVDFYGYTPFHFCNFVDLFIVLESFNKSVIIDDDIFHKIFVSTSISDYHISHGKAMFNIAKKYNAKFSSHMGIYFSKSIDRLKLLEENNLLETKMEDGDTIFHIYLNFFSGTNTPNISEKIVNFLLKTFSINVTNDYGETPAMLFLSSFKIGSGKILDIIFGKKVNFHQKNIYGETQGAYMIHCDEFYKSK